MKKLCIVKYGIQHMLASSDSIPIHVEPRNPVKLSYELSLSHHRHAATSEQNEYKEHNKRTSSIFRSIC